TGRQDAGNERGCREQQRPPSEHGTTSLGALLVLRGLDLHRPPQHSVSRRPTSTPSTPRTNSPDSPTRLRGSVDREGIRAGRSAFHPPGPDRTNGPYDGGDDHYGDDGHDDPVARAVAASAVAPSLGAAPAPVLSE